MSLSDLLEKNNLGNFFQALEDAGVETVPDIQELQLSDLKDMGLSLVQARRLLRIASEWASRPQQ